MPRKPFAPGAALVAVAALAAGLAGCTGGPGTDGDAADAKGGDPAATSQSAEPGRYQTLPEACGLPSRSTVRAMLPGDGQHLSGTEADKLYGGQADITYDTDRRVGCHWTRETDAGTRHLSLDIQRVVSYDAAVSDDDKAQEIYDSKELAAQIPSGGGAGSSPTAPPSKGAKGTKSTEDAKDTKSAKGGATAAGKNPEKTPSGESGKDGATGKPGAGASANPSGDPSAASTAPSTTDPSASGDASTAPRVLDGLADAAFLNDKLITADSGVHRDVTVVFRTSNVIVTITYDQWSTDKSMLPESQELQDKARSLADELSDRLAE
ncbi:hypothetical protein [Streptomyces endophytica]|uniref:DUF3558 domain-containing protein n=1 Tax=Streptomyces endophytica TaxID=2991496 RepID=A0ABY6PBF8_9ACTN|nr:hypothetical protein [Streptomyces endophytica]UZJ30715.1 hypothetical protein OJ254_10585 [Streptomyces endophytica]